MPRWIRYLVVPGVLSLLIFLVAVTAALFAWERFVEDVSLLVPDWLRDRTPGQIRQAMATVNTWVATLIWSAACAGFLASFLWFFLAMSAQPGRHPKGAAGYRSQWLVAMGGGVLVLTVFNVLSVILDPANNIMRIVRPAMIFGHGAATITGILVMFWLCTVLTTPDRMKPAVPLSGWRPW
ncbi:MAG: hypothetical protein JJU18_05750 [Oceanicaulis sp.]|nr:hypothetical protein [Oceanicaulis sp.]